MIPVIKFFIIVLTEHKGGGSQTFIMRIDGEEAAFLSYEDWSEKYIGFIYEIYVLPEYRYQGIEELLLFMLKVKLVSLNVSI
ncbi:GNAT family N-acetyltransferase [Acinetobacter beijerinckii]|uniref:GNAT family N-acetyltransferase n=1 Tax=Acinetobacter beijerinckii TaxID=262668 RepID=UPI0030B7FA94